MFPLLIFIFGLAVGSFLNLVICRLETKEPILFSRSHCPQCGAVLKWFDLIPLLSFLIQKGRCRYGGRKISWQYPLVELATGALFLSVILSEAKNPLVLLQEPLLSLKIAFYLIIVSLLIIIFVYDLKHYLIPDKIIYPAIIIALLYRIYSLSQAGAGGRAAGLKFLLAALISAGFFLSLVLISKGKWLGLGDVKLALLMGLVLGWPNILFALFLAFVSGAIIGLGLIMTNKKTLKSEIPFGPFLAGATILVMLSGQYLANWQSLICF